jgi:hypothetical protein
MTMNQKNNSLIPTSENLTFCLIDVQEKLMPAIHHHQALLKNLITLCTGLSTLKVQIVITEQYPKGLGPTIHALKECISNYQLVEKITFSAYSTPEFRNAIGNNNHQKLLLYAGIEAHVCVLQSVVDSKNDGWRVGIVADAIQSRTPFNCSMAIERMKQANVEIYSTEMILFALLRSADHPQFKAIHKLIK